MSEFYLTKAIEAGREAAETFTALDESEVAIILHAALPEILTAYAEVLDMEIDRALLGGDEEEIADTEAKERILNWLRAKAEEAGA